MLEIKVLASSDKASAKRDVEKLTADVSSVLLQLKGVPYGATESAPTDFAIYVLLWVVGLNVLMSLCLWDVLITWLALGFWLDLLTAVA